MKRTPAWLLGAGVLVAGVASALGTHRSVTAAPEMRRQPARVELGRRLFFDPAVSQSGEVSCASCHDPNHGFSDPAQFSKDEDGLTVRHSQPLLDARFNPSAHRDGEFDSIEELVLARLGSRRDLSRRGTTTPSRYNAPQPTPTQRKKRMLGAPITPHAKVPLMSEMTDVTKKLPRARVVEARLEDAGTYKEAFRAAFGARGVTLPRIARALAEYCRSIESTEAPVDRFLGGSFDAIDRSALRGLALFRGRAGCAKCHTMDVEPHVGKPLFTNYDFHNTGIATRKVVNKHGNLIVLARMSVDRRKASLGRFHLTRNHQDQRAFKTPTLRDVAKRAPYMHDGSMETLEEVIRYYANGCGGQKGLDERIQKFECSDQDVADLVAFLHTLDGDTVPGAATKAWSRRTDRTTLTFRKAGKPAQGLRVVLEGSGDVIRTSNAGPQRVVLTTNASGQVRYRPSAYTHMRIIEPPPRNNHTWPWIPDTCRTVSIDLVSLAPTEIKLHLKLVGQPPDRIVAERVHSGGLVLFHRLPDRSRAGWARYRAWIPVGQRLDVLVHGQFVHYSGRKAPDAAVVLAAITTGLPLTLAPDGAHELGALDVRQVDFGDLHPGSQDPPPMPRR